MRFPVAFGLETSFMIKRGLRFRFLLSCCSFTSKSLKVDILIHCSYPSSWYNILPMFPNACQDPSYRTSNTEISKLLNLLWQTDNIYGGRYIVCHVCHYSILFQFYAITHNHIQHIFETHLLVE